MKDSEKKALKKATRQWTKEQVKQGSRATFPVIFFSIVASLAGVAQMWCVAVILGTVLVQWQARLPLSCSKWDLVGFIAFALLRALCIFLKDNAANKASIRARRRIRREVLQRVVACGPLLLKDQHSAQLTTTIVDRIEALDGFFANFVPSSRLWILIPLIILIPVWMVQPFAALVLGICGLAVPIGQAVFGIGAMLASRNQFLAMTRLQTRFLDRIRGIATIVLAGRVNDESRQLSQAAEDLRKRTMKILRVAFFSSASIDCAMVVAFIVLAIVLGRNISAIHNHVPLPVLTYSVIAGLFSLLVVPEFFLPLRALALAYQDRAHAQGAGSAILELPEALPRKEEAVERKIENPRKVNLAFDHVSFAWDKARGDVLKDVSFFVPECSVLAVTGQSGAGKSTLLDLILGFVQPQSGTITINGIDLGDYTPKQRSQMMSWIGQDPVIFSGTMRENILFAKPDATDEELDAAINGSGLGTFLGKLPKGLDTPLGEGGFGLSGGQAQRVVIARAWLKDAPLLLLDEPSSHLDQDAEKQLFEALKELAKGRTVIIVTHSSQKDWFEGENLQLQNGRVMKITETSCKN